MRLCLIAFAVCVAALLAHAAIDALGDVFLAHDAYDDVAHGSRAMAAVAAAFLVAPALFRFVASLLRAVAGEDADLRELLRRSLPRSRACFAAVVAVFSLPLLTGMEALDVLAAGGKIDDLGDLLAGAPLFSIVILTIVAVAVALAVYQALAFLLSSTPAILAALSALLAIRRESDANVSFSYAARSQTRTAACLLARHGALRAPPPFS